MATIFARTAAALAAAALIALPAQAASTGTIQLNGTVAQSCTVAVVDANQALNLTDGENRRRVGTVTETCNVGIGYRVTLSSGNGGRLVSAQGERIDYQVHYEGQGGSLGGAMVVDRGQAQFGRQVELQVTLNGSPTRIAGDYSDTITISIAAK